MAVWPTEDSTREEPRDGRWQVICSCGYESPVSSDFDDMVDVRDEHGATCGQTCVIEAC